MLDWLQVRSNFYAALFVLYCLLAAFFLVSRRMNARVDAVAPAPRQLRRLAQALLTEKSTRLKPIKRALARLLEKADRLLYDKLKLLPDARTGRRLNFFLMLLASWMTSNTYNWFSETRAVMTPLYHVRDYARDMAQPGMWRSFIGVAVYVFLFLLPFFLIRKNREAYFDITALFMLLYLSFFKLAVCWGYGCCFGIPWPWGVHNDFLDTTVFPVQLFEFAAGVICSILCILFMLYAKSYRPGRGCTVCLLSYAVPRFFWEYLRYTGEDYRFAETNGIFGLTMVQIMCIGGVIVAVAWLFVLPLEKKWMDRFWLFAAGRLRGRSAAALEEGHTV